MTGGNKPKSKVEQAEHNKSTMPFLMMQIIAAIVNDASDG